jgi:hypothetical protein
VKAAIKRTEFWISVLIGIGALIAGITDVLPAEWAAAAATISAASYAHARGIKKYQSDFKRGLATTEFWIAAATVAGMVAAAVPGGISAQVAMVCSAVVAAFYAVSRGAAKQLSGNNVGVIDDDELGV